MGAMNQPLQHQKSPRKGVIQLNQMFLAKLSSGLAPGQVVTICRGSRLSLHGQHTELHLRWQFLEPPGLFLAERDLCKV